MLRLSVAFVVAAVTAPAGAAGPTLPLVGLTGKYGDTYTSILNRLGCDVRVFDEEQLAEEGFVSRFDAIIVSHLDAGWPEGSQGYVSDWVEAGGLLLCEIAAIPPAPILEEVPVTLGWAPGIIIDDPRSPLADGLARGQKLPYGAWGGGLDVRPRRGLQVVARWDMTALPNTDMTISPDFRPRPAAWVEIEHGEGLCVYSGPALSMIREQAVVGLLRAYLGPEALPLLQLEEMLDFDVAAVEPSAAPRATTVAVLDDSRLPIAGLPDGIGPDSIARILTDGGYSVIRLDADALADDRLLNAGRVAVLVLAHGEVFPMEAVPNLKRFLSGGGRVLSLAGVPLSHLCTRRGRQMVDCGEVPSLRRGSIDLLFEKLLPYSKLIAVRKPTVPLNLAPEWLPNTPLRVGNCEEAVLLMPKGNGLSSHTRVPLLGAAGKNGDLLGVPLTFSPHLSQFPAGGMLAIGFVGNGHPLTAEGGPALLKDCVDLLLRRDYVLIEDVWTGEPCYYPGERVEMGARIRAQADQRAEVLCLVQERDSGRVVGSFRDEVNLQVDRPADVSWTWTPPEQPVWAYDVVVQVTGLGQDPPPAVREETEFLFFDDYVARRASGFEPSWWGTADRDGTPAWLSGANLYFADTRGVGFFFTPTEIPGQHPLVDFLDRDASHIRLLGGNAARQHYFDARLDSRSFDAQPPSPDVRALDAYNLMLAHHDVVSLCDPHTFDPNHYWKRDLGDENGFTDPAFRAEDQQFYRRIAERPAAQGFRNIFWELINEPEVFGRTIADAEERSEAAKTAALWTRIMQEAVANAGGGPAGIGQSTPTLTPVWDPRGNLYPLPLSNVHSYSPSPISETNGHWCVPLGLNYGRPAVVGEFGEPNAAESRTAFLGDWTASYDQLLHIVFGERAVGFLNFYLNCGMGAWASPEWGVLYPDYTEKPSALAWKRWNVLCSLIRPADIAHPTYFTFVDSQHRLREPGVIHRLNEAYLRSLGRGVFSQIISERDLADMLDVNVSVDGIFVPKAVEPSEQATQLLQLAEQRDWPVWRDDDPFEKVVRESAPIRLPGDKPRLTYIRALTEGGWLVTLVAGDGDPPKVRAGEHDYRVHLPEGRCGVLGLTAECELFLFEGAGDVAMDGETLLSGPRDGYLVASRKRRPIASEAKPLVWADAPAAVEIRGQPARFWPASGETVVVVRMSATPEVADAALLVANALKRRDMQAEVREEWPEDAESEGLLRVAIGAPTEPLIGDILAATGRVEAVMGEAKSSLVYGSARMTEPWLGAIAWDEDRRRVAITGLSPAAIDLAARKLTRLAELDTYSTAPFGRTADGGSQESE